MAQAYIDEGSVDDACPPLRALLHIMASGHYEDKTIEDPAIRKLFTRDYLLQSDWYQKRLRNKQARDAALWRMNHDYLKQKIEETLESEDGKRAYLQVHIMNAEEMIETISSDEYLERLTGTLGADWIHRDGE